MTIRPLLQVSPSHGPTRVCRALALAAVVAAAQTTISASAYTPAVGQDADNSAPAASGATESPAAAASEWPQSVTVGGSQLTLFQPEFQSIDGIDVQMSAVLSIRGANDAADAAAQTAFVRLSAKALAADVPGEVEIQQMRVVQIQGGGDAAALTQGLDSALAGMAFTVDRATLVRDMALANARAAGTPGINLSAPKFVDSSVSAALVSIDGEPMLAPAGDGGWQRVKNTPFIVLQSPAGRWYVQLGMAGSSNAAWYSADDIRGDFAPASDMPPASVTATLGTPQPAPAALNGEAPAAPAAAQRPPQRVIVATEPTVLVAIDGAPQMVRVAPGVRAVQNANCVLLHEDTLGEWWTLQSGRWFHAAPGSEWSYAAPGQVPASFANLQAQGRLASARASVPGTPESRAAVLAAREVRTVTVNANANCQVSYQGDPQFSAVSGATGGDLGYAVNSSVPVLGVGNNYYCCDSGAWFVSSSPTGPWTVTDQVPSAIYGIPASNPDHPVTYVEVYGSQKDASGNLTSVTFGFSAGYLGTYLHEGTAVYGTGYDYSSTAPSDSGTYQPTPETYGSGPQYDPQTGTFAPYASGSDYDYLAPAVQPIYLDTGWTGWGWCPGWNSSWGWGWNNWNQWNSWGWWWNHWNPYWNPNWHNDWSHDHRLYANSRASNALAGRSAASDWKGSDDWHKWNGTSAAQRGWQQSGAGADGAANRDDAAWRSWNNAGNRDARDGEPNGDRASFARSEQPGGGVGGGWNTPNRGFSNPYVNSNWGATPRNGASGFHPAYSTGYSAAGARAAAPAYRGGGRR